MTMIITIKYSCLFLRTTSRINVADLGKLKYILSVTKTITNVIGTALTKPNNQ